MTELQQLYELQELDSQIDELTETLADLESQLTDDSVVAEAKRRVAVLENHAEQLASRRRSIDRAIEDLQTRLGRTQERMYSGSITSVKEMEAAEEERANTERDIAENEDSLLEVMVRADEVDETLAKGRQVVKRLEDQRSADVAELTAKAEETRSSLDELTPRRDSDMGCHLRSCPPSVRDLEIEQGRRRDCESGTRDVLRVPGDAQHLGAAAHPLSLRPDAVQLVSPHPLSPVRSAI